MSYVQSKDLNPNDHMHLTQDNKGKDIFISGESKYEDHIETHIQTSIECIVHISAKCISNASITGYNWESDPQVY